MNISEELRRIAAEFEEIAEDIADGEPVDRLNQMLQTASWRAYREVAVRLNARADDIEEAGK